jgi:DNA-binding winged helix-turn-helix (wHTH) protein/predicted ATPase
MMDPDLCFGPFRLDLGNECLWHGPKEIILRPKSFAVLRYLVTQSGRLVTRTEVSQAVWPGIAVSDAVLTVCIGEIRQALQDSHQEPQFIETVHRRGYRFRSAITVTPGPRDVPGLDCTPEAAPLRQMPPQSFSLNPRPSTFNTVSVVGREAPVSKVEGWLHQALSGLRQVAFVAGEAGIGKTAVVDAFLTQVKSGPPLWVARGQCIAQYGSGEAYLPVLDALARLCREPRSAPLVAALDQYAPTWLVQMPALLGVAALESLQRRVGFASRERMLRELAEAVEVLTIERPLILVLEDLHWSDFATLDLISWLAQRREPARLLVLGTYRPVDVIVRGHPLQTVKQELLQHQQCSELSLELLTAGDVAQYLADRFALSTPLSVPLQALALAIHQRTDGHPLFMVTLVNALVQQGRLVERDGAWAVPGEIERVTLEVPESLQQLVEQQLSELSLEDQRMLEAGSVAGMQFSAAAVAAGLEEKADAAEAWCSTLARRGQFLQSTGIEEWSDGTAVGGYRFRHTLYQQVVYDRLPVGRRILLHGRIEARLEAGYRELAPERAAELATHFEQGREFGKALQYFRLAAEKALQRYAYQESVALLSRCLAVLPRLKDTPERTKLELDLQIALGQVLTISQGPGTPAVIRVYTRAQELCPQVGDLRQRIAVLRGLRRAAHGRGEPKTAQPLAEEFLRFAQQAQDPTLVSEGCIALGVCLYYLGQVATAHTRLQEGLAIYADRPMHPHVFPSGQDLRILGVTYDAKALWILGYPEQALAQSRCAMKLAEEVGQPWGLAMALGYGALIHALRGDRQATLEQAGAVVRLAVAQGIYPWVGRGIMLRGWALAETGPEPEGLAEMQQGLATWQATGQELGKPFWLGLLGARYAKAGSVVDGLQVIHEALAMAQMRAMRLWEAELHRLQGELLLQQAASGRGKVHQALPLPSRRSSLRATGLPHPFNEAEACFRRALEIARGQQAKSLELRAAMSLSRLWQQQGKKQAASRYLEETYLWFTEGFDTADLREARLALEQLAGGKGSYHKADRPIAGR